MQKFFDPALLKRILSPALALAALITLSIFAPQGRALPVSGLYEPTPGASSAAPSPTSTPMPRPTLMVALTPNPRPLPTPQPPPVDFKTADLTGTAAPIMEQILKAWGFKYYKPDAKWTDADIYELKLFQRWAKIPATGRADGATRQALSQAWRTYRSNEIPREKLPLEGRYIGVNPGHQARSDSRLEALSPEKGSPKRARVSGGTSGVATKIPEYKTNLTIALKLRDRLEAMGARVLMARSVNDVKISNAERARMMNAAGVDVYFSIHCNGNRNRKAVGLETLVPKGRGNQKGGVLAKSKVLATCIQTEVVKASGAKNLGYSYRRDLSSLNWPTMPTCLIELGYMTNPAEDRRLNSPEYQGKLVGGMVNAFILYFKKN